VRGYSLIAIPMTGLLVWLGASGVPVRGMPTGREADSVTFVRDIAPILHRRCAGCHHPGGSAPFPLISYDDARSRGPLIVDVTARRYMPPWLPADIGVPFRGERRLSDDELRVLREWVDAGMPKGSSPDRSAPPAFPSGWTLGEPDLVVEFPVYEAPARGRDIYRNLVAAIPVTRLQYVASVEIRPGASVVHHARMMVDTTASSRQLDARDPESGFNGMDLRSSATNPDGFFVGWTPGKVAARGEGDLGWPVRPGTDVVLQLHIRPNGEVTPVRPRIGFYFARRAPRHLPVLVMLGSETIDIPAGDSAYVVRDSFPLSTDVDVLGVYPHAHYLGHRLYGFATLPGGKRQWLLRIDDWDFNWQDEYHYRRPIHLPRGSVIHLEYRYDNSGANPRNPNHPPRRVRYGPNSTDEMADLVVQVMPTHPRDRADLLERLNRKYYTAGMVSLAFGERITGDSLVELGELDSALSHYRGALSFRADDPEIFTRMVRVLVRQGDAASARTVAEHAAQLTGYQDAGVLGGLAAAYAAGGHVGEAIRVLEQAIPIAEARRQGDVAERLRAQLTRYRARL